MDFFLDQIKDKVLPLLEAHHYKLYKFVLVSLKRRLLIRVFIENETGVTVGDCEKVSRLINDLIFTENLIESAYVLEVSSPGIDKPLESAKDYQRNIGRKIRIAFSEAEKQKTCDGILEEVSETGIMVQIKKKVSLTINYAQINKANVLPQF